MLRYFIGTILYMLYSIGPINVCTDFEINRYKIDEVRKYAKIVFYFIYLTSRDAKTYLTASGFFKIPGPQWAQSGLHIMQTYIWPILKKKR